MANEKRAEKCPHDYVNRHVRMLVENIATVYDIERIGAINLIAQAAIVCARFDGQVHALSADDIGESLEASLRVSDRADKRARDAAREEQAIICEACAKDITDGILRNGLLMCAECAESDR